jgi:hypothetical protein
MLEMGHALRDVEFLVPRFFRVWMKRRLPSIDPSVRIGWRPRHVRGVGSGVGDAGATATP